MVQPQGGHGIATRSSLSQLGSPHLSIGSMVGTMVDRESPRTCRKCGETKAAPDFIITQEPFRSCRQCRECRAAYQKDNYEKNRDARLARQKNYVKNLRLKDPDGEREKNRLRCMAYRHKDPVAFLARQNSYIAKRRGEDPIGARRSVRNTMLKKNYGITLEDFEAMMIEQSGRCAICLRPEGKDETFHVDHCHNSEKVRGILCDACNHGVGKFKDNPATLRAAADYLERFSAS